MTTAILNVAPSGEPVSLAEAKAYLKVEYDEEDQLIQSLITAARAHLELATRRAFITQSWSLFLDRWPRSGMVNLPLSPVGSVDALRVYDPQDSVSVVAASEYGVDVQSQPPRVVRSGHGEWRHSLRSLNGIEIAFTAGFGPKAEDIPAPLRQAILLLVAHWFENRQPLIIDGDCVEMPLTVKALIAPYRMVSL
ncbi:MAG: head-tail connector protein [Hyphomicrobiales bacterium]